MQRIFAVMIMAMLLLGMSLSCREADTDQEPSVHTPSGSSTTQPQSQPSGRSGLVLAPIGDAGEFVCRKCPESDAEAVLIAELTIPGLITQKKYEFPFRREFTYDLFGYIKIPPGSSDELSIACGPGAYHHSSVQLTEGVKSPLTLSIYHSWRSDSAPLGAKIDEDIPLTPGSPEEQWNLPHGATLKVTYRKPQKP
jgi:hypothetical protein